MSDAHDTGARVLAALARGRERAIEAARARGAVNEHHVRRLLDLDILAGHRERGRAARIARRMPKYFNADGKERAFTAKGVKKIMERLSSGSDSPGSNAHSSPSEIP